MTYRGVFAGGCGTTYGHHAVWQQYDPARHPEPVFHVDRPWLEALTRPGTYQMGHLRRLMESRPQVGRIPDQNLLAMSPGHAEDHARACRDEAGQWAMVYANGAGRRLSTDPSSLSGERLRAWWFEPRSGGATPIGESDGRNILDFTTPLHAPDWVLVLDDAEANFGVPGARWM